MEAVSVNWNGLASEIDALMRSNGFPTARNVETEEEARAATVSLMLVITEIAEAMEAEMGEEFDSVEEADANYKEEIADAAIRLLHLFGAQGIDISDLSDIESVAATTVFSINDDAFDSFIVYISRAVEALRKSDRASYETYLKLAFAVLITHSDDNDWSLYEECRRKHEVNKGRPFKHNKLF